MPGGSDRWAVETLAGIGYTSDSMKKIVHLADLHLGARLHDRDRLPEQRRFLDWLCEDLLAKERPDALVLAGDLFDIYYPPAGVQGVWLDFLARVRSGSLAGAVVAIAGNHDSPSSLGCTGKVLRLIGTRLLAGDTAAGDEAFLVPCADGGHLAFAAVPFLREGLLRTEGGGDARRGFAGHAAAALAAARALDPAAPVVAVAHTTVDGATLLSDAVSERGRRAAAVGGVDSVPADAFDGADYVALGHLHRAQTVGGREAVRYAGSPLPMSFAEAESFGGKTLAVVEFDGGPGAPVRVRSVDIPSFRELHLLSGDRGKALAAAAAWSPSEREAGPAWAALSVTEGEGSFSEICEEVRAVVEAKGAELVVHTDDRAVPVRAADDAPLTVAAVQALDPLSLARDRLSEPDLHLSESERDDLLALVREVLR